MRLQKDIYFSTADGFECLMRVVAEVMVSSNEDGLGLLRGREVDYDYRIETMEMIEFHGQKVSVELDVIDTRGNILRQIRDGLDDHISKNLDEILDAESEEV